MGDLTNLLTLLLTVITLSTAAGVGFQRGKIGQLRGELNEERQRRERQGAELKEATDKTEQLQRDLDALSRVVTGEAHWIAIGSQLEDHHDEARTHWRTEHDTLERIATALERNKL